MRRTFWSTLGTAVIGGMMMVSAAGAVDNGTITAGGLVMLKDASCLGAISWGTANSTVAGLSAATAPAQCNLKDGSTAGQWRLPNSAEIHTIRSNSSQLINVQQTYYWTSYKSVVEGYYGVLNMQTGQNGSHPSSSLYYVVPVRNP
jgi:hypothetical protein